MLTVSQRCDETLYRHTLRQEAGAWQIARKHIHLLNDTIPTVVNFYSI